MSNKQVDSLTKIDYSCLIGSQVLMEFWDYEKGDGFTGFLVEMSAEGRYRSQTDDGWINCRIYQHKDYWISNADGGLVLPDGLLVKVITLCKYEGAKNDEHKIYTTMDGELKYLDFDPMIGYLTADLDNGIIAVQVLGAESGYQE